MNCFLYVTLVPRGVRDLARLSLLMFVAVAREHYPQMIVVLPWEPTVILSQQLTKHKSHDITSQPSFLRPTHTSN